MTSCVAAFVLQAYVGGEVTASGRTAVPIPEVQEEVFDLSALEALAQGARAEKLAACLKGLLPLASRLLASRQLHRSSFRG